MLILVILSILELSASILQKSAADSVLDVSFFIGRGKGRYANIMHVFIQSTVTS